VESLRVALAERSYPINIGAGLIDRADLYPLRGTAAIVTNDVVAPLYLARVRKAVEAAGARVVDVTVPDGEQAKGFETLNRVFDRLLTSRLGRDAVIVALGGGVVGDLAGFAAATYQRGIDFIQVPTTLLAQVDSSVGGKTAINHPLGKNMIGAFHQPRAVISDVQTLDTLPDRELRAGLAEVIKHGVALDAAFVEWLERNMDKLLARDRDALIYAVRRSCELKAAIVAIEAATGFGPWLHGEAVASGMVIAAELSVRAQLLKPADAARIRALVARAGLPVRPPALAADRWHELMSHDKKAAAGRTRFILLEALGRARQMPVEPALVEAAIGAAAQ
jgi:3-dehydroquinate synthase